MQSLKQVLISLASTLVLLAVLFVAAGRVDYWQGWAYAVVSVLMSVGTRLVLRSDPDLARERSRPGAGAKSWDKSLLGLGLLLTVATLVIAGLDSGREHWSPRLPWPWSIIGMALSVAGMVLFLLALRENRFFSSVVRIQADRAQTVCSTGPYTRIRHPGNAGMIIGTVGFPFLFTSVWVGIPTLCSVVMLVVRTHLEDVLLAKELEGYRDYQRRTRFRLVPGIW
jgi:protein-S-isoprenylcysteine O-methyltransferase Ste14